MSESTIFDDVFRSNLEKAPHMIIPVINEVFQTDYRIDESIEQGRNELLDDGKKRITDSLLKIRNRCYHMECESNPDRSITIRMIEYDFMAALDAAEKIHDHSIRIRFPRSCVLYLRHEKSTPDNLTVQLLLPDDQIVQYKIPVVKVQSYSADVIFQKQLYFFIPYYILRYEKQLKAKEKNPDIRFRILMDISSLRQRIQEAESSYRYPAEFSYLTDYIGTIADYILKDDPEVRKGVHEIMRGKILTTRTDLIIQDAVNAAIEKNTAEVTAEVTAKVRKNTIYEMVSIGDLTLEAASRYLEMDPGQVLKEMKAEGYPTDTVRTQ